MLHRFQAQFVIIFILFLHDIKFSHEWESNRHDHRANEHHHRDIYTPRRETLRSKSVFDSSEFDEYKPKPIKTELVYNHQQIGSAPIPHRGARVLVSPDHNQTTSFVAQVDTTIISPRRDHRKKKSQYSQNRDFSKRNNQVFDYGGDAAVPKICLKCPPTRTVIAQKGLDGVLITPPSVLTCANQRVSKAMYEIRTLFSPNFNFVLPQGTHSFIGRIWNKRTNRAEQTCTIRYKVIVPQCGLYHPKNPDLKVTCDLGGIWGSKCSFACKSDGTLSHYNSVTCGDDYTWVGDEPQCLESDYFYDNDSPVSACELPILPDNGRFSCDLHYNGDDDNTSNFLEDYPDGTICRIKCNDGFKIPTHLDRYSTFLCSAGEWNTTTHNLCHRNYRTSKG